MIALFYTAIYTYDDNNKITSPSPKERKYCILIKHPTRSHNKT